MMSKTLTLKENKVGLVNRQFKLFWQKMFLLVLLAALGSTNLFAQTITIDGNPSDWNSTNFNSFLIKKYQLDAFGNGVVDNQFTEGSKDFFQANQLVWSISQTKAKNDIANAAAILVGNTLYFAGDRTSNNGDAQIGFWLYLNGTAPVTVNGRNIFAPNHVDGDVLVLADFTGGGRNAVVTIYQWDASGNGNVPNTNGNLRTTSLSGTVAENNDGSAAIPIGWNFPSGTYERNMFYEGQVNLGSLNLGSLCNASFLLETRSSQSVTASLDDFVGGTFRATPLPLVINGSVFCSPGSSSGSITSTTSQAGYSYQLKGTGAAECTSNSNSVSVVASTVSLTANGTNPNCFGSTGSIEFSATSSNGGTITYTVNGNAATSPFVASASGTYTIVATNANGCTDTKQVTITIPSLLTASSSSGSILCKDGKTDVTVSASGGTAPYTGTGTFNVGAGTYTYTVTDANGCTATTSITVTEPSLLTASSSSGSILCKDGKTDVTVSASGGTAPYTGTGTFNVGAGTYTYTVTDANGCTATTSITVTEPTLLTTSSSNQAATCAGTSNGSITVTFSGGTSPYQVNFNGGGFAAQTSAKTYSGLAAGSYTWVVKDANGCEASGTATVDENPNPTCSIAPRQQGLICISNAEPCVERVFYLEVTNEFGCKSTCEFPIGTTQSAPCTLEGPEKVCANTDAVYTAEAGSDEYIWTIEGDAQITSTMPYGNSITVKAGAAGSYTVKLTIINVGQCPSSCEITTTVEACSKPLCTYTQGYYGNSGGTACTPTGSSSTFNLIKNSIANMPGGQLQLGTGLRRFIATSSNSDVDRIIRIMPGGGSAAALTAAPAIPGYWTPSTVPVSGNKIRNVLLSQSIALALNVYMPNSQLGSFSLAGAGGSADLWMVTVAKTGDCSSLADAVAKSCTYAPKYECVTDPTVITGYTTTYNPYQAFMIPANVINALPGDKTVADLLKFASDALGGATLPAGVSLSNINAAVDAINRGFDECRIFVEFKATSSVTGYCTPPAPGTCPEPEPIITSNSGYGRPGVNAASESNVQVNTQPQIVNVKDVTINAYPNPFRDVVNFRFISPAKGRATLELFTVYGQRLGVLFDGDVNAGTYNFVKYDKINPGNNMLIYKLTVNGKVITGKVQSAR